MATGGKGTMTMTGNSKDPPREPLEPGDVAASVERAFAEAHAAGAGSDPEALPELPPDADAAAPSELSVRMMGEAVERYVDAITELAEYRRCNRRTQ